MKISTSNIIGWGGFIVMIIAFLLQRGCISEPVYTNTSDTVNVPMWDTVPKFIPAAYQGPSDSIVVEIPAKVDTAAILARYFKTYYYSQILSDTNLVATITDSVSQNSLRSRTFTYKLLKPTSQTTIINTTKIDSEKKRNEVFAGGFASVGINGNKAGLGVTVALKTKKELMYSLGYDAINQQVQLGVLVKFNLGKK